MSCIETPLLRKYQLAKLRNPQSITNAEMVNDDRITGPKQIQTGIDFDWAIC
jgi:hypothetical protein